MDKALNVELLSEKKDELPENIDIIYTKSKDDNNDVVNKVVENVLSDSDDGSFKSANSSSKNSDSQSEDDDKSTEDGLSDDPNSVMYKIKDSDRLYFDDSFPI